MAKPKLVVCASLDVEEEGLFSGSYPALNPGVRNIARLPRLAPLQKEFGIPLTLFCSHAVFANGEALKTLELMRDQCGAEIAAHLHHWSTPPGRRETTGAPLRTHLLPRDLLEARLDSLFTLGESFQGAPIKSFRMGRWDLKAPLLPLLAARGVEVDSSICPLRSFAGGADHFLAPADPYRIEFENGSILEAPITQIPLFAPAARAWHLLFRKNQKMLDCFHFLGALSANPLWHGPLAMRVCARLHSARGGLVLSLFWHSSEMTPGCSPHIRNEGDAEALLARIFSFFKWLGDNFDISGRTVSQLAALPFKNVRSQDTGDWA